MKNILFLLCLTVSFSWANTDASLPFKVAETIYNLEQISRNYYYCDDTPWYTRNSNVLPSSDLTRDREVELCKLARSYRWRLDLYKKSYINKNIPKESLEYINEDAMKIFLEYRDNKVSNNYTDRDPNLVMHDISLQVDRVKGFIYEGHNNSKNYFYTKNLDDYHTAYINGKVSKKEMMEVIRKYINTRNNEP